MVSSAAESVTTLNTLPGSNGVVIARLLRAFSGSFGPGGQVRIVGRIIRHRQNLAGVRIHRHDRSGSGAARFAPRLPAPSRRRIADWIDGQRDVRARLRLAGDHRIVGILLHVGEHARQAGTARQVLVEARFDARRAALGDVVRIGHPHRPQHVRGQRVMRIEAADLRTKLHPVQLQAAQALGFLRHDLSLDPQKPAASRSTPPRSSRYSLARSRSSTRERRSAAMPGSGIFCGLTHTDSAGRLFASGWPLRSRMVPRSAGISLVRCCCCCASFSRSS